MSGRHPDGKDAPVAQRLRRLRETMAGVRGSAEFARSLGFTPQRWSNFENGFNVPRDVGHQLTEEFPGLSLDWIFKGKIEALSVEMAIRLGELPRPPHAPRPEPPRPRDNKSKGKERAQ